MQSASYSSRKATELTIQTKEGDNITIRLINNQSASATQFSGQGNGLSLTGSSSRSSSQSGFEIQVEGNLNEEEQAAIKDLLGRVDQLAGDFFQGNVDEAFSKALELGFDTEQLSNFSLNLSYSEERAVTAYQQNSSGAGSADASAGAGSNQASGLSQFLQQASDFLKQFKQLLEDDGAKKVFKNPGEAVSDIFTQLVQDRKEARGDDKDKVEKSGHQLRDFLQALTEQVKAQRTGALGAAPAENEEASDGKDAKAKDGKEPAAAA